MANESDLVSVNMMLDMEPEEFELLRPEFIRDLAALLEVPPDDIVITEVTRGCTDLGLLIPLSKRELFELIKRRHHEHPSHRLIEIANFLRKYKVMTISDAPPAVITNTRGSDREAPDHSLTWLHISDLHFKAEAAANGQNAWAQDTLKETFVRDFPKLLTEESLEPDIVFLSGDVAHSGHRKEYDLAESFLGAVKRRLPHNTPVMLVPGNHDVTRSEIERYRSEEADARRRLKSNQAVNDYLCSPAHEGNLKRVLARLDNFAAFAERCGQYGQPPLNGFRAFSVVQTIQGVDVGIAGFNSAWRCGSTRDQGRVILGSPQIEEAIDQIRSAHVRIALIHHPPESECYLLEDKVYQREAMPQFDFVLPGHEHEAQVQLSYHLGREYCRVSAGTLYPSGKYQNSFNVVQLDIEMQRGWVFFWRFAHGPQKWVKDVEVYPNGYTLFDLPQKLADRLASVAAIRSSSAGE